MSQHHRRVKHTSIARVMRPRIAATLPAPCIRCGGMIAPGDAWDVGHRADLAAGGDPWDVGPEHRTRTGRCAGNRNAGGRLGAQITNTRRRTQKRLPNW